MALNGSSAAEDRSDELYDPERRLEVQVELAPADWSELREQGLSSRSPAERCKSCRSRATAKLPGEGRLAGAGRPMQAHAALAATFRAGP